MCLCDGLFVQYTVWHKNECKLSHYTHVSNDSWQQKDSIRCVRSSEMPHVRSKRAQNNRGLHSQRIYSHCLNVTHLVCNKGFKENKLFFQLWCWSTRFTQTWLQRMEKNWWFFCVTCCFDCWLLITKTCPRIEFFKICQAIVVSWFCGIVVV